MPVYVMYGKSRLFGKNFAGKIAQAARIRLGALRLQGAGCCLCSELEAEGQGFSCKMCSKESAGKSIPRPHLIEHGTAWRIDMDGLPPRIAIDTITVALDHPHNVRRIVLDRQVQRLEFCFITKNEIGILSNQRFEGFPIVPCRLGGHRIERDGHPHIAGMSKEHFEILWSIYKQPFCVNHREMRALKASKIPIAYAVGRTRRDEDTTRCGTTRLCTLPHHAAHRTKIPVPSRPPEVSRSASIPEALRPTRTTSPQRSSPTTPTKEALAPSNEATRTALSAAPPAAYRTLPCPCAALSSRYERIPWARAASRVHRRFRSQPRKPCPERLPCARLKLNRDIAHRMPNAQDSRLEIYVCLTHMATIW